MLVRDIMTTDLTTLREDETMLDANLIFARAGIHHIPIVNGRRLAGLVTDKDLKHYSPSILSGLPLKEYNGLMESTPLSKIMTRTLLTIESGKTVREAAQILNDHRIGCLPVVEGSELKGIITNRDLVKLLLQLLKEI
jgi:acetoin utilization protein AcuB